ncbi:hypothetical protein AAF712_005460 [Marasmius tenuissimus]|uniref:Uncharacterized protein n=1 Tax=Marasmius tenuissimus TaxID=585030 RepID=A0ABR3A0J3_9AGAR
MADSKNDQQMSNPWSAGAAGGDQRPPMYPQASHSQQSYPQPQSSFNSQQQPYSQPQSFQQQNPSQQYMQQPGAQRSMNPGEAYGATLFAACAQGMHTPKTEYGIAGILAAIICFPCGLLGPEQKTNVGHSLLSHYAPIIHS